MMGEQESVYKGWSNASMLRAGIYWNTATQGSGYTAVPLAGFGALYPNEQTHTQTCSYKDYKDRF